MKTKREIESAISAAVSRFEQVYMGRDPKEVRAFLVDDLVLIRLKCVLTAAERHLVKTLPPEKVRDLLKDMRRHLLETGRPTLEAMIKEIVGVKVVSLHHDISTLTGEKVVLFTLASWPIIRKKKKK